MNLFAQTDAQLEEAVRQAVARQLHDYPLSTLKDLYKSFFQDAYGPGHMINNASASKDYLTRELNSYSETKGLMGEPTGYKHNFYRVNLSVIKNGTISFETFFEAFLESADYIKPVDLDDWKAEWKRINNIIQSMQLNLPNYKEDNEEIISNLEKGDYVGHHSKSYGDTYDPHYRIINSEIFKEKLSPILNAALPECE